MGQCDIWGCPILNSYFCGMWPHVIVPFLCFVLENPISHLFSNLTLDIKKKYGTIIVIVKYFFTKNYVKPSNVRVFTIVLKASATNIYINTPKMYLLDALCYNNEIKKNIGWLSQLIRRRLKRM